MQPTIGVTRPGSGGVPESATINNPLYTYYFQSSSSTSSFFSPFNSDTRTYRNPDGQNGPDDENATNQAMHAGFAGRQESTYDAITSNGDWDDFSGAIENVHNGVHTTVGGQYGHMTEVPVSAFDPIFWLHHCNIDRMMAFYQATHPGVSVTSNGVATTTFSNPNPGQDGPSTPLWPFRKNGNAATFYVASDMTPLSSMYDLNYGYTEIPCSWANSGSSSIQGWATSEFRTLYGTTSNQSKKVKRALNATDIGIVSTTSSDEIQLKWLAKIVIDVSELSGTYTIFCFFGTPDSDPSLWPTSNKSIGSFNNFGASGHKMHSRAKGVSVPLTAGLVNAGVDTGSVPDTTEYLKKELNWGVLQNGTSVDVADLKTLRVAVTSTQVTVPADLSLLPVWGTTTHYFNVTSSKRGGAQDLTELTNPLLTNGTTSVLPSISNLKIGPSYY